MQEYYSSGLISLTISNFFAVLNESRAIIPLQQGDDDNEEHDCKSIPEL